MDAIVTARVPIEIKEQGNSLLRSMGATPTQLINAAYRFLLAEKRLPCADSSLESLRGTHRKLSADQRESVSRALNAMYVGPVDDMSYREALAEARDKRYATFA